MIARHAAVHPLLTWEYSIASGLEQLDLGLVRPIAKTTQAKMLRAQELHQASDGTETETVGSSSRASSRTPIEQLVCHYRTSSYKRRR
ncbi:hypothetical protein ACHAXN_007164 [Cyclotella atomus]